MVLRSNHPSSRYWSHGGIFRVAMSREDVALVVFLDALNHSIDILSGLFRVPISAHDPHDIVEFPVSFADVASPIPAFLGAVRQSFFHPTFFGADVAQINGVRKP